MSEENQEQGGSVILLLIGIGVFLFSMYAMFL